MLDQSNLYWICATGLCSLVNLIFLVLLPVLAFRGLIDGDRIAHLNTVALSLIAVVSTGSACWLVPILPSFSKLRNGHETTSQMSNRKTQRLTRLYVWVMFLCLALGSIAFVVLAFLSSRFESIYQTALLVWKSPMFCLLARLIW